jgi:hypothetical protein
MSGQRLLQVAGRQLELGVVQVLVGLATANEREP